MVLDGDLATVRHQATGELVMQSVMADDQDGERVVRVRDPSLVAFDDDWMLDGIDGKTLLGSDDADADDDAEDGGDAVMPEMAALAIGDAPEDDADETGKTGLGRLVAWAGALRASSRAGRDPAAAKPRRAG